MQMNQGVGQGRGVQKAGICMREQGREEGTSDKRNQTTSPSLNTQALLFPKRAGGELFKPVGIMRLAAEMAQDP
jgi:hypothetical protein